MPTEKILGIDLGTTNTAWGIIEQGDPRILPNSNGNEVTPSVVGFRGDEILVGNPAVNQEVQNPDSTVKSIKRKIGREDYTIPIGADEYTPQEISAHILRRVKNDTADYYGEEINRAVITVPAYFTDRERQATKQAGEIAGLQIERIINEPTAAAIAYGIDDDTDKTILVFDLGGGTFDVSILDIGGGVYDVIATNGDSQLGGDDWDEVLVKHFNKQFEDEHGVSLLDDLQARARLRSQCEETKKQLTHSYSDEFELPFITTVDGEPKNLSGTITRERFRRLSSSLLQELEPPVEQVLEDACISKTGIDDVILVGGSTRMPMVQQKVEDMFKQEPQKHVEQDKAVALGATIQAGIITGETDDAILLDVTPQTLGIEVKGGMFEPLIPRNTTLPTEITKTFTTVKDGQRNVYIRCFQGEDQVAEHNRFLDEFVLSGIPQAEAGTPEIDVTFRIDLDGIVHVTAEDIISGSQKTITIESGSGIAGSSVEELKEEQEEMRRNSEQKQRERELRARGQELIRKGTTAVESENVELGVRMATRIEDLTTELETLLETEGDDDTVDLDKVDEVIGQLEHLVGQLTIPETPAQR